MHHSDSAMRYVRDVSDNPEMYERIKKEIIFKIIFTKVEKPTKNVSGNKNDKKPKLTEKEKKVIKHLRYTYELVKGEN